MKKAWKVIKTIFKVFPWIVLGILSFFHIVRSRNEEAIDDLSSSGDIVESVVGDRTSVFRDRTGQVLRGIFSNRGYRERPGDSGRGDTDISTTDSSGIYTGDGEAGPSDSGSTGNHPSVPERHAGSGGQHIRPDRDSGDRDRLNSAIEVSDKGFLNHVEGAVIRRNGLKFLCLLAPIQFLTKKLSVQQVIDIYDQGKKDPAIMDRKCNMGNKDYLVTYHQKKLQGLNKSLIRVTRRDSYDFIIKEWRTSESKEYALYTHTGLLLYPPNFQEIGGLGTVHYYRWL